MIDWEELGEGEGVYILVHSWLVTGVSGCWGAFLCLFINLAENISNITNSCLQSKRNIFPYSGLAREISVRVIISDHEAWHMHWVYVDP